MPTIRDDSKLRHGERWTIDPENDDLATSRNHPLELCGAQVTNHGLGLLEAQIPPPAQKIPAAGVQAPQVLDDSAFEPREITLKLRLIAPVHPAATNRCPYPLVGDDPLNGWSLTPAVNPQPSTLVGLATDAHSGDFVAHVVTTGAAANEGVLTSLFAVDPSKTYTAAIAVRGDVGGEQLRLTLEEWTGGGVLVGSTSEDFAAIAGEWLVVYISRPFGSTGAQARIQVRTQGTAAVAFQLDSAMLVEGGWTPYFDGDSPGCAWTGAAGASTSTRAAGGDDRFLAVQADMEKKAQKLTRERGSLRRWLPQGEAVTFDVLEAWIETPADRSFGVWDRAEPTLHFRVRPFFRRDPVVLSDHVVTDASYLSFTEPLIPGAVPALGRLVVDNDEAADQHSLIWGMRSWGYDPAATAALFYEAEGRKLMGLVVQPPATPPADGQVNYEVEPSHEYDSLGLPPPLMETVADPGVTIGKFAIIDKSEGAAFVQHGNRALAIWLNTSGGALKILDVNLVRAAAASRIPAVAGQAYSGARKIYVANPGGDWRYGFKWYNAAGAKISESLTAANSSSGLQTHTLTATAPAGTASVVPFIRHSSSGIHCEVYTDQGMFLRGTFATPYSSPGYFDGDFSGYMWTGEAGESASQIASSPALAASVVSDSAASGGSAVQSPSLSPVWSAFLSTNSSDGAFCTHRGVYGVWARLRRAGAGGDVGVRLEWGQGDYRTVAQNEAVILPDTLPGDYMLVYLGEVSLEEVVQGDQRWEGRIVARSTASDVDRVVIDWLMFVPTERGGIASAVQSADMPTSFLARENFAQAGGNLAAKVLPIGGSWQRLGELLDDFAVDTIASGKWIGGTAGLSISGGKLVPGDTSAHLIRRSDVSLIDAAVSAKFEINTTTLANPNGVRAKCLGGANDDGIRAVWKTSTSLVIQKRDGGVVTDLATATITALAIGSSYWIRLKVVGNVVTAEHYTADPALGNSPVTTATYTLTGSDVTKFGAGVKGSAGMVIQVANVAWRMDDFRAGLPGADFAVDIASHSAQRTAISDGAPIGAGELASATDGLTSFVAQVDMSASKYIAAGTPQQMLLGRVVDALNFFAVALSPTQVRDDTYLLVFVVVNGVTTELLRLRERHLPVKKKKKKKKKNKAAQQPVTTYTVRLMIDATGRWTVWMNPQGHEMAEPIAQGRHDALATGGALAAGRVGIADLHTGAGAVTRSFDDFYVAPLVSDAAMFAGQSLEIRHDRALRQNPGGAVWTPISDYEGDYVYVPPSSPDARTLQIIAKATRGDPDLYAADSAIADDLSARLTLTPRGIHVPDPS